MKVIFGEKYGLIFAKECDMNADTIEWLLSDKEYYTDVTDIFLSGYDMLELITGVVISDWFKNKIWHVQHGQERGYEITAYGDQYWD